MNNFDPLIPARYPEWIAMIEALDSPQQEDLLGWLNVGLIEGINNMDAPYPVWNEIQAEERYHFYTCAISAESPKMAQESTQASFLSGDYKDSVIIEGKLPDEKNCSENRDEFKYTVFTDKADRQVLQVENSQDGWLIQSDTWYPGWQASVDGEEVPLYRADYYLRGIRLDAGLHTVSISYSGQSFQKGWLISAITGFILIFLLQIIHWKPQPSNIK